MFGSQILDVAVGMILVFLLASLIASALREAIETQVKARAVFLESGIRELLDGKNKTDITRQFYEHPLIYSLFRGDYETDKNRRMGGSLPTYIPAKNFAEAVIDLAVRGPTSDCPPGTSSNTPQAATSINVQALRLGALRFNPQLARAILIATDHAGDDLAKASKNLQDWFDSSMDRVSGRYKRNTNKWLLAIGFVMAAVLNINALRIGEGLWRDKTLRDMLVQHEEAAAQNPAAYTDSAGKARGLQSTLEDLKSLNLPIGWTDSAKREASVRFSTTSGSAWFIIVALLGYLFTGLAVTLGAPFWFDLLSKVIVLRSTVKPHEKSPEEASKDRQDPNEEPKVAATTTTSTPQTNSRRTSPYAEIISAGAALAAASVVGDGGKPNVWANGGDPDEGII